MTNLRTIVDNSRNPEAEDQQDQSEITKPDGVSRMEEGFDLDHERRIGRFIHILAILACTPLCRLQIFVHHLVGLIVICAVVRRLLIMMRGARFGVLNIRYRK